PAPSFRRFVPCFFRFARPLPTPALFPYTTLFRSVLAAASVLGAVALFLRGNLRGVWRIVVPVILLVLAVLLRVIDAKFWGVVAMGGSVVILFFLPWLDHSPVRSIRYRPTWHKYLYGIFIVTFLI